MAKPTNNWNKVIKNSKVKDSKERKCYRKLVWDNNRLISLNKSQMGLMLNNMRRLTKLVRRNKFNRSIRMVRMVLSPKII